MAKVSLLITKSKNGFKFYSGNISLRDEPNPWCSSNFDQEALWEVVDAILTKVFEN